MADWGARADRIVRRLWEKYGGEPLLFECWIWPADDPAPAYVVMWEDVNGMLPVGQALEHTCPNPTCCNPLHLLAREVPLAAVA